MIVVEFLAVSFIFLVLARPSLAVCPLCTIAVGTGLGLSRLIGVDDSITGIWIGGIIFSSSLWLANWLNKKGIKVPHKEELSIVLLLLFTIPFLYWGGIIGIPGNSLLGIDKILFGMTIGFISFFWGVLIDKKLKDINNGKVLFYYQKVILPLFFLSLSSFIIYLII